jgi:small subunit ribosomal protein S8
MQDPVADMLTRIRNGYMSRLSSVKIPYSKLKMELARVLSSQGLVGEVKEDDKRREMVVELKYDAGQPAIEHIKRVSKPGLRVYQKSKKLRRVRGGLGLLVVSTSKGLMTGDEARKNKLGGEVVAEVW